MEINAYPLIFNPLFNGSMAMEILPGGTTVACISISRRLAELFTAERCSSRIGGTDYKTEKLSLLEVYGVCAVIAW